ncbi:ABC transporter permease [Nocardia jinanensis]|uniref:ABC transmembrane type-1 domain-containing protein n=1 Tax=Nocardia jinanensis TaxID=382504 RepID=A0A917VSX3_9NOCA|nr:ABC transporter permease [Nocardia jinanensis]GGL15419.1 hypothetical protein GCM10011588_32510 [Nocardia jinanensis]
MVVAVVRALCRDRVTLCALVFLAFITIVVVAGPFIVGTEPNALNLRHALVSPNGEFWLGTDALGRDQFSRLVDATRVTMATSMFAIGIVFSPSIFRIVRGATMAVRSETYVEAAVAIGCRPLRIMFVHVLRNTFPPVLVQVSLLFGIAMIAEANLGFLGLGVTPPQASWGSLLRTAFDNVYTAPFSFSGGMAQRVMIATRSSRRRSALRTFPIGVRGRASRTSRYSGVLCRVIPGVRCYLPTTGSPVSRIDSTARTAQRCRSGTDVADR